MPTTLTAMVFEVKIPCYKKAAYKNESILSLVW